MALEQLSNYLFNTMEDNYRDIIKDDMVQSHTIHNQQKEPEPNQGQLNHCWSF